MRTIEFVAELSASHLGSLDRALEIVDAAAWAGATAFKLQTWTPDTMCIDRSYALASGPWKGRKLFDLYREAWTPWGWHEVIFDYVRAKGMTPFSAAFDIPSVDFLETLGVDRHKVASFELLDLPLIRYMATKGKPIILSMGMASIPEMIEAVTAVANVNSGLHVVPLACVSEYPAKPSDANLGWWASTGFRDRWGLSDHSLGIGVACAAASLGSCYIEKHLTLRRSDGGPDARFAAEPHEFREMVDACLDAASAVGDGTREVTGATELRRSLWAKTDIAPGDVLRLGVNVVSARPALGLPPSRTVDGYKARIGVKAGQPIVQAVLG